MPQDVPIQPAIGPEDSSDARSAAPALTSPLLERAGFRHAFFSRAGGVSGGAYASLNFSYAVGDAAENVDENLRRAALQLGVSSSRIFFLAQVHGSDVVELNGAEEQRQVLFTEGDALVSDRSDLACAVRTADCVPVLLADQATGRVAAVHAGWRGIVAHVLRATAARLGGAPRNWLAAVGPHISGARFEVSEEIADQIVRVSSAASRLHPIGAKPHVDLRAAVNTQLCELGILPPRVDNVHGCTYGEAERFFSFRRDGKHSGRHLSAIVPRAR